MALVKLVNSCTCMFTRGKLLIYDLGESLQIYVQHLYLKPITT